MFSPGVIDVRLLSVLVGERNRRLHGPFSVFRFVGVSTLSRVLGVHGLVLGHLAYILIAFHFLGRQVVKDRETGPLRSCSFIFPSGYDLFRFPSVRSKLTVFSLL